MIDTQIAWIWGLAFVGALLSGYGLKVRRVATEDPNYKPLCDISENISCTKALLSKEGSLTGLPNPYLGMMIYMGIILLASFDYIKIICYIAIGLVTISVYLAYISYIKQKNFCLLCTAIYLINVGLLIVSWGL